jgi:hypothetical protein
MRSARKTAVVCCHLLDEDGRFEREPPFFRARLGCALPEQAQEVEVDPLLEGTQTWKLSQWRLTSKEMKKRT